MSTSIKKIVEQSDTLPGKVFDLLIQSLIVVSLVGFAVETLPGLDPRVSRILGYLEVAVIAVFTVEYVLRLTLADRPVGFVFSLSGLIDLAAILPFYLSSGLDLRSLRVFRLLRLIRAAKLVRYSRTLQRFTTAFRIAKEEIILFMFATVAVIYLAAVGIYYCEHEAQPEVFGSVFHSLWWAVATLTTVGYGDAYPVTVGGKLFTFVILMLGLGVVAAPAGILAAALSKARELEEPMAKEHQDPEGET